MSDTFILISKIYIFLSLFSFIFVSIDLFKYPQSMKIMNIVYPITMLWGGIFTLFIYLKMARQKGKISMDNMDMTNMQNMDMQENSGKTRLFISAIFSAFHCGAGCTLADIIGEILSIYANFSIALGWSINYILALIFGFAFQYFAIKQMSKISFKNAIIKSIKADFLSLSAWQLGMYAFMGSALFWIFKDVQISKLSVQFWFLMQMAMAVGFIFAYPVNIILVKMKIKEPM